MRLTFEEGSEIQLDTEEPAYSAGWEESPAKGSDVLRVGALVTLALRVKNAAKAAALIATLPVDFRPLANVIDKTGKLEVKANGEVVALNSSVELEASSARVYEISYRAAAVSP